MILLLAFSSIPVAPRQVWRANKIELLAHWAYHSPDSLALVNTESIFLSPNQDLSGGIP